jgi:hypothetical protein
VGVPQEIRFDGMRVRYDSAKSYDDLLAALLADIGDRPGVPGRPGTDVKQLGVVSAAG